MGGAEARRAGGSGGNRRAGRHSAGPAGADPGRQADPPRRPGGLRLARRPGGIEKLDEEVAELRAELPAADPARLADELGDVLFVMANLARKLGLDAERCLREANAKFARRFAAVEAALAAEGRTPAEASLDEMEQAWQHAKRAERGA